MKRVLVLLASIASMAAGLAACQPSPGGPQVKISDVWGRPSPIEGGNAAIYMLIMNTGSEDDRLIGASSGVAEAVEMHDMTMENDVMKMFPVDYMDLPAGSSLELKPGGKHIMFIGLHEMFEAGQTVRVVLEFEKAGEMTVEAEIREE
jgi:copper(I)-binding protein